MRIVLATLVLLAACGPDSDDDAGDEPGRDGSTTGSSGEVQYSITCAEVLCPGADDSVFRVDTGFCSWKCADYEGQSERRVVLDFVRRAGCWEFGIASVSDGDCQ